MMEKAKFEELRVYQQALKFVQMVYRAIKKFPKEEIYGLTSQFRRAAMSVPLNIAEGQGRGSRAENKHFLMIARGSLHELIAILEIAFQEHYVTRPDKEAMRMELFSLLRQINSMIGYFK